MLFRVCLCVESSIANIAGSRSWSILSRRMRHLLTRWISYFHRLFSSGVKHMTCDKCLCRRCSTVVVLNKLVIPLIWYVRSRMANYESNICSILPFFKYVYLKYESLEEIHPAGNWPNTCALSNLFPTTWECGFSFPFSEVYRVLVLRVWMRSMCFEVNRYLYKIIYYIQ